MFRPLQIDDPFERLLVRLADLATAPLTWTRSRAGAMPPRRILLLRLERIGDLVMVLEAIAWLRARLPEAEIDLAVGGWNAPLAALVPRLDRVERLDVPWLAREGTGASWRTLVSTAWSWRARRYDLVVNFEPDIRSNFLAWLAGGRRRAGYSSGGGGAFLTEAIAYQPNRHVTWNAGELAAHAIDSDGAADDRRRGPMLEVTAPDRDLAARLLDDCQRPLVGVHVNGGRPIKQWPSDRFGELARRLIDRQGATIVLTGTAGDRELLDSIKAGLAPARVVDASGAVDLSALAALIERMDLLITGDTGPMHLAHAVDVPTVSIFGPSDPVRYAPPGDRHRVVRVDLPCSPCNRIRRPPERCTGHTPNCLAGVSVAQVYAAASEALAANPRHA